jgi:hypothetical protein
MLKQIIIISANYLHAFSIIKIGLPDLGRGRNPYVEE